MRPLFIIVVIVQMLPASVSQSAPSLFEKVGDGIYVVRDDLGNWGGMVNGITHQCAAPYQAKKVLDLTDVPDDVWQSTKKVRLSAYFMVRDYSWHEGKTNGLDEAFEIVINGKGHRYPTSCGAPVYIEGGPPAIDWYDFVIDKGEFTKGRNEIILRKAESAKNDDYLYLGIDNSEKRGNSYVAFDGKAWTQERLTVPGGNGEYMVRMYLIVRETAFEVKWQPGQTPSLADPARLVEYAGIHATKPTAGGLLMPRGEQARVEWDGRRLDLLEPITVKVESTGDVSLMWVNDKGEAQEVLKGPSPLTATLPANRSLKPSGCLIAASGGEAILKEVTIQGALSYHPIPARIDICPHISKPMSSPRRRTPSSKMESRAITMETTGLRCKFTTGEHLQLTSLYNEYAQSEMVRNPSKVNLFIVEVNGKRYSGSNDFVCRQIKPTSRGFSADLTLPDPSLRADLGVSMEQEGLRLSLNVTNVGNKSVDFKVAFPHLAGLAISDQPREDYYFFPWGGGIIADTPSLIRRGYGDHEALYQVMDLFSPSRGAGLYIRADDKEGWHKILALRKYAPGGSEVDARSTNVQTTPEYKWTNCLDAVEGTGFTYEYLRRTRAPGQSFAPAAAVLSAHPGDWHVAMKAYSDWAHRVWKFRPYPSRLKSIHHMVAAGWAGDFLFRDGKYRTDIIAPPQPGVGRTMTDCIELMSWWDWSPLGPWSTPFDKLKDVLDAGTIKMWEPYFVKDPVTGQTMWNGQPGDYEGYNERFGGLPAFRKAIQTYKAMGALVTLYTDPFRLDDACKIGKKYGKLWGVVGTDGKHTTAYDVWNPCHDDPDVRQWVADTMKRVMRETGADGIRLDEYGYAGWACFSDLHKHTYEERGDSQWNKAVAETVRMVHAGMDEVAPGSVLTTEHPGYDYLMKNLEGCINYDLTVMRCPLRPLECNLQRFYFRECKPYELDFGSADPKDRKKFWNAVDSFGRYYPVNMYLILRENEDVFASRDCEALIPTIAKYVYANRFTQGDKTIYTIYNATGHTFEGATLALKLKRGERLFDLLNAKPCDVEKVGNQSRVRMYLERDNVACIIKLPQRMAVAKNGDAVEVKVKLPVSGCRLVVCDVNGKELTSQEARRGSNQLQLSGLTRDSKPVCVKLLRAGQLMDIAAW